MSAESISVQLCLVCNKNLKELGRNRKALYCGVVCKNRYRALKNPEEHLLRTAKYKSSLRGKAIVLFHGTKNGKRQLSNHEITPEWILEKLKIGRCEVTNLPFVYSMKPRNPWSPSVDRINPQIGYTLNNTRVVVWIYNAAKNVFSDQDVLQMSKALIEQQDGSIK